MTTADTRTKTTLQNTNMLEQQQQYFHGQVNKALESAFFPLFLFLFLVKIKTNKLKTKIYNNSNDNNITKQKQQNLLNFSLNLLLAFLVSAQLLTQSSKC